MLESETLGLPNSVVVNFVQVNFRRRIVHVMLVRRIAGPIPARRVNLNYHQLISRKCRADDIYDLARCVSATTQAAHHVCRGDEFWLKRRFGWRSTFCNFTNSFRGEHDLVSRRQIKRVRKTIKNILALSDPYCACTPIDSASAAQKYECSFLLFRARPKLFAGLQAADEKAHPIPLSLLSGQMKKFTALVWQQINRMDEKTTFAHVFPTLKIGASRLEE